MDHQGDSHCESAPPNHGRDLHHPVTDNPGALLDAEPRPDSEVSQDHILSKLKIMDPTVDPSNPAFDFDRWSHMLANLRVQLGLTTPIRSGFVFQNLTVRGHGSAIAHQDTVWTKLTSPFRLRRWWRAGERNPILHGLDGVLQKGELLLVLGQPGSHCTTFLKTITGQTRGLELDSESLIEYRGTAKARILEGSGAYNKNPRDPPQCHDEPFQG